MKTNAECSGCGKRYSVRPVGANPVLSCPSCGTRTPLKHAVIPLIESVEPPPIVSQCGDNLVLTAAKSPATNSTNQTASIQRVRASESHLPTAGWTTARELLAKHPGSFHSLYQALNGLSTETRAVVVGVLTAIVTLLSVVLVMLVGLLINALSPNHKDVAKGSPDPGPSVRESLRPVVESDHADDGADVIASMTLPTDESAQQIAKRVQLSIVTVKTDRGLGSGFVIDDDGSVATNYHVIEGARSATLLFRDGEAVDVTGYRRVSPSSDLAILVAANKLPGREPLPLRVATPEQGEKVLAFGAPRGLGFSLSDGLVSALRTGREIRDTDERNRGFFDESGYGLDATWIQTTCAISPGNSGGPLLDMQGRVVGINTFKNMTGESLNFAVSARELRDLMRYVDAQVHPLLELPPAREDKKVADAKEKKRLADEAIEREREARDRRVEAERIAEMKRRRDSLEQLDRAQKQQAMQLELGRINDRLRTVKLELAAIEREGTALYATRGQVLGEGKVAIVRWNQIAVQVNAIQARLLKISNAIGMRRNSGKFGPIYTDGEDASWDEFGIAQLQREATIRQSDLAVLVTEGARLEAIKSGLDTKFDLLNSQLQYKERQRADKKTELEQLETQYQELSAKVK